MTISHQEMMMHCRGQVGTIYMTYNRDVMIIVLEDWDTYLIPYKENQDTVTVNPPKENWINNIDCTAGFKEYWFYRIRPTNKEKMPYKAPSETEISQEQLEKLNKRWADSWIV